MRLRTGHSTLPFEKKSRLQDDDVMSSVIKMDSGGASSGGGTGGSNLGEYDWSSEENAGKWRGLFVSPLHKVLNQVHPQFTAKEDALEYVENLLIKLLAMLTAKPVPVSVSDVEVNISSIC